MQALLFILYAALLGFILTRSSFLTRSGLSEKVLIGIFLFYSIIGCVHLFIAYRYFPDHGDVWGIFNTSINLKYQLLHNYPAFQKEMFPDAFSIDISGTHIGWSYYQQQMLVVIQMLFNFISFDNIYVNILLFNFLMMFGRIAFYSMMTAKYSTEKKSCFVLAFCIPSIIFWTSVIHKEGLLFLCLGIFIYLFRKTLISPFHILTLLAELILLFLIFITRKAVFLVLIPALIIWWANERLKIKLRYSVPGVLIGFALLLIIAGSINSSWNLFYQLNWWQQEFLKLNGGSKLFIPAIHTDALSIMKAMPYAILNGVFMPLPGSGVKSMYYLFFLETAVIWVLILWSILKRKVPTDGFTVGFFLFAIAGCIIIGYTVPFAGAIVRYRSIFYPFLLLSALKILSGKHSLKPSN